MGRARTPYSHWPTTARLRSDGSGATSRSVACRTLSSRNSPGLRLDPEPGLSDLGDEFRVAGLGLLAEENLGRSPGLGLRPDPDEQEVGAGLAGQAQEGKGYDGCTRQLVCACEVIHRLELRLVAEGVPKTALMIVQDRQARVSTPAVVRDDRSTPRANSQ